MTTLSSAAVLRDSARLQEIADLDLTSPDVDAELQRLAADAAAHFGLPIALVSIVLDEAQYLAASHGADGWVAEARGTPVEWTFCRFAVATRETVVITDMLDDERAAGNPIVEHDGVRCYAGVPLISTSGHALGSFCVLGGEARAFTDAELGDLRAFAARALAHIEARRTASAAAR
jgi:GAF domain-containing protein